MLLLNLFTTGVISDAESLKNLFLLLRLKRLCFFVRIFFCKGGEENAQKSNAKKALQLILMEVLNSVTRFGEISPLLQKFTSLWQIFRRLISYLSKCQAYFGKFVTLLG